MLFKTQHNITSSKVTRLSGRQADLQYMKNFKPQNKGKQLRILLHGPVGAGKSSFINSAQSALHGRICVQALADNTSHTCFTKKVWITFQVIRTSYKFSWKRSRSRGSRIGQPSPDMTEHVCWGKQGGNKDKTKESWWILRVLQQNFVCRPDNVTKCSPHEYCVTIPSVLNHNSQPTVFCSTQPTTSKKKSQFTLLSLMTSWVWIPAKVSL